MLKESRSNEGPLALTCDINYNEMKNVIPRRLSREKRPSHHKNQDPRRVKAGITPVANGYPAFKLALHGIQRDAGRFIPVARQISGNKPKGSL
jgi:hypothetical protein